MIFDEAFEILIGHEGGYVNDPRDPGGETKFGVSKRSYPAVNIKALTLKDAKAIYLQDFWIKAYCPQVPASVRFDLFDMAVNSGVGAALRALQAAVGAVEDGVYGPATQAAVSRLDAPSILARFNGVRLRFMADLPAWSSFGRGWARRIATNLMRAGA